MTSRVNLLKFNCNILVKMLYYTTYFLIFCAKLSHFFLFGSIFFTPIKRVQRKQSRFVFLELFFYFTSEINPVSTSYTAPEITTSFGIKGKLLKLHIFTDTLFNVLKGEEVVLPSLPSPFFRCCQASFSKVCAPQSVWCKTTISRVPICCWEITKEADHVICHAPSSIPQNMGISRARPSAGAT